MSINIDDSIEEYRKYIKNTLPKKRYQHSLSVSYISVALAMRYEYDLKKAQIAGLLHDCAKSIPKEDQINMCTSEGIILSDYEINSPELIHAKLGAHIVQNNLKITDKEIINAIYYHTTGRPNMTLLEKIIFIADFIEPYRSDLENLDKIRKLSFINMDEAICKICASSIIYLQSRNALIDPLTEETYRFYNKC